MKKNIALTLLLALASASNAMAYSSTDATINATIDTSGLTVAGSVFVTASTLAVTDSISDHAKDAVLKAQPDAVAVLKGSPASDAFVAAREAVETEAKINLGSDRQAAAALLEIAGAIEAGR